MSSISSKILEVLNGTSKKYEGKAPLGDIEEAIESIVENLDMGELDTNGWQVDYWLTFEYNSQRFQLSGSMFYGTFCLINQNV